MEKKKLAFGLHDGLAQTLLAIKTRIEHHLAQLPTARRTTRPHIDHALLQRAIEDVQTLATGLRPSILDDHGLLPTIDWFCREFERQHPQSPLRRKYQCRRMTFLRRFDSIYRHHRIGIPQYRALRGHHRSSSPCGLEDGAALWRSRTQRRIRVTPRQRNAIPVPLCGCVSPKHRSERSCPGELRYRAQQGWWSHAARVMAAVEPQRPSVRVLLHLARNWYILFSPPFRAPFGLARERRTGTELMCDRASGRSTA